jgi:O-antigen/teichoic acid export membrane protein
MTRTTEALADAAVPAFGRRTAATNLLAHGAALVVVSVASVLVARSGGAAVLGQYTLLRVLPWLTAVVVSSGLPLASTYFLGRTGRADPRLRPTIVVLAGVGAAAAAAVWVALTPLLHHLFFPSMSSRLVAVMAITVVTQLWTVLAKACCQGSADMLGANLVILTEELMFLPAFGLAVGLRLHGIQAVAAGMIVGGVCATVVATGRLARRGFFRIWASPSRRLAWSLIAFGARGQLGNLLWLVNLRLDFILLAVIAGPATLGIYAVASKCAELMRLPATALSYVLYPRFTRATPAQAAGDARRLLHRATLATLATAPVLAALSIVTLPVLFGESFRPAIAPACILLIGLAVEGAAAVANGYLLGTGRPGAYSLGMGLGVVVTVALDLLLIPRHGAIGAAVASSIAYLSATGLLTHLAARGWRRNIQPTESTQAKSEPDGGHHAGSTHWAGRPYRYRARGAADVADVARDQ